MLYSLCLFGDAALATPRDAIAMRGLLYGTYGPAIARGLLESAGAAWSRRRRLLLFVTAMSVTRVPFCAHFEDASRAYVTTFQAAKEHSWPNVQKRAGYAPKGQRQLR